MTKKNRKNKEGKIVICSYFLVIVKAEVWKGDLIWRRNVLSLIFFSFFRLMRTPCCLFICTCVSSSSSQARYHVLGRKRMKHNVIRYIQKQTQDCFRCSTVFIVWVGVFLDGMLQDRLPILQFPEIILRQHFPFYTVIRIVNPYFLLPTSLACWRSILGPYGTWEIWERQWHVYSYCVYSCVMRIYCYFFLTFCGVWNLMPGSVSELCSSSSWSYCHLFRQILNLEFSHLSSSSLRTYYIHSFFMFIIVVPSTV
jgi:hypothetical protein